MAAAQSAIIVTNIQEGKRFKLSLRGDVATLSVRKLKRSLEIQSGLHVDDMIIKFNGVELDDNLRAGEVGITAGSGMTIERRADPQARFVSSPARQALEFETLDQQRVMLDQERHHRDSEFQKQQEALKAALEQASHKRQELEDDRRRKEAELERLRDMEERAAEARLKLDDARRAEEEREAARLKDIDARKDQLKHEKTQERQLEMMRLENERKKMLLEQQRAEYEGEKARLERERQERQERIKRQELLIKEREIELERVAVDAERTRRQIAFERDVLEQQRSAEFEQLELENTRPLQTSAAVTPRRAMGSIPRGTPNASRVAGGAPQLGYSTSSGNAPIPAAGGSRSDSQVSAKASELAALRREKEELAEQQRRQAEQPQPTAEELELDRQIEHERREIEALRSQASGVAEPAPAAAAPPATAPAAIDTESPVLNRGDAAAAPAAGHNEDSLRALAVDQLHELADELGVDSLALDDNNTCVVSIEDRYTLLITFDVTTQRIYLYSTLSTFLPRNPETKLRLYEFLLEGALLGRDMCGGGVGVSLKNDFILLSTSVFLPKASRTSLRTILPTFVETLVKWRTQVRELLADDGASGTAFSAAPAPQQQQSMRQHVVRSSQSHSQSGSMAALRASAPSAFVPEDTFVESAEQPLVGIEAREGDDGRGIVVLKVRGPAARAGMLPNDVVRKVDGLVVGGMDDFQHAVRGLRPHVATPFVVERAGAQLLINVLVASTSGMEPHYGVVNRTPASGIADGGSMRGSSRQQVRHTTN